MDVPWWAVGLVVATIAGVVVWFFKSTKRWPQQPAGKDPEAQDAEAELWSTRTMDQR